MNTLYNGTIVETNGVRTLAGGGTGATTAAGAKAALSLTKSDVGLINVDNTSDANKPVSTAQATAIASAQATAIATAQTSAAATYVPLSQKGANNGIASLDSGGKVPVSQLPSTVMEYLGVWNASTNTPRLTDGMSGVTGGSVYNTSVGGTVTFGTGNTLTFQVGDWVIYNGTKWQQSPASDEVISVNGKTGVVSLGISDIPGLSTAIATAGNGLGSTRNYISVSVTGVPATDGANLLAAYTAAKALTPNGAALSATNRAVVFLPPAVYNTGTGLQLNAQYVDIIGLSPDASHCTVDKLSQTANDVHVSNITIAPNGCSIGSNLPLAVWTNCKFSTYGGFSSLASYYWPTITGTFIGCVGTASLSGSGGGQGGYVHMELLQAPSQIVLVSAMLELTAPLPEALLGRWVFYTVF